MIVKVIFATLFVICPMVILSDKSFRKIPFNIFLIMTGLIGFVLMTFRDIAY